MLRVTLCQTILVNNHNKSPTLEFQLMLMFFIGFQLLPTCVYRPINNVHIGEYYPVRQTRRQSQAG